jgi:hypothetical protein
VDGLRRPPVGDQTQLNRSCQSIWRHGIEPGRAYLLPSRRTTHSMTPMGKAELGFAKGGFGYGPGLLYFLGGTPPRGQGDVQ